MRIFHTEHKEDREEDSPSFFNQGEVEIIKELLLKLLLEDGIELNDIGIMAPYRKQEERLKQMVVRIAKKEDHIYKGKKLEIEDVKKIKVGTVEHFQGQEKNVIIISIVRSTKSLLKHDKKFKLGLTDNYKRMNVSVSRARELMLIVGNVEILKLDQNWKQFMDIVDKKEYDNCIDMEK